jgi:hypothetical protein
MHIPQLVNAADRIKPFGEPTLVVRSVATEAMFGNYCQKNARGHALCMVETQVRQTGIFNRQLLAWKTSTKLPSGSGMIGS